MTASRDRIAATIAALVAAVLATVLAAVVLSLPLAAYAQEPGPKNESDCPATSMSCGRAPPRTTTTASNQWRVEVVVFVAAVAVAGVGYRVVVVRMARRQ